MTRIKLNTRALATAMAVAFSAAAFAQSGTVDRRTMSNAPDLPAAPVSKDQYKASTGRIQADFKAARASCNSLSANSKDICVAEAKATEKIAKSELEARYKNTAKARYDARVSKVEAEYSVATEKCDDRSGNAKDVCIKEAKLQLTRGKADAKSDRQVFDARSASNEKVADARADASESKRDAEYALAREKCDTFSGDAKDRCIGDAKARFGKI